MKIIIGITILTCLVQLSFGQKICNIKLRTVEKDINTPYRIPCDNFDASFSKIYKEKIVKSPKILADFDELLRHVVYSKENSEMDVRTKIIVQYLNSKKKTILCLDAFDDILVNGRLIKSNQKLLELINRIGK